MSKVIFLSLPFHGHINPTLDLVRELIQRGEEVIYYATDVFRKKIEDTGAVFRSYRPHENWDVKYTADEMIESTSKTIDMDDLFAYWNREEKFYQDIEQDTMNDVLEDCTDYIIHDSYAKWGEGIARALDIPEITYYTTFAYCEKMYDVNPEFVIRDIFRLSDSYLANIKQTKRMIDIAVKYGRSQAVVGNNDRKLNIVYTSKCFQVFSECFDESYKFVGPQVADRNDRTEFPFEKLEGKPLIYISMGSIVSCHQNSKSFYKMCFEAFGDFNMQVVLSLGGNIEASLLGEIPCNFIVRDFVPQIEILKRASLFITHGGMNSVNEALYHHVPMIVYPQGGDQPIVAMQVEQLGAGICLRNSGLNPRELREAAEKIFKDPTYINNCKIIEDSFKSTGGYKEAVDEIFALKEKAGI
ncbi:macrolide family glycosyltransferase [Pseudobacteroides cellulosolvens]|uniref:Glycosyltransferase, MGT family n=1 Tax=Pseudobacteroides cellulosolvens ATCC 35603 = DSM 2933 TaxID=398512 RepID=A0A0L6JKU1_9FIRM|nr:macrolide family glycosyltransferase [Pseudobacteroides cellulosolvens]KNY26441.1 glycosyltransferase, MGT family [Pseudobacteroides cellulosolvens ATCC 35603 = DSM 2933]